MIADRVPGPLRSRRRGHAKGKLDFEHALGQPPRGSLCTPATTTANLTKGTDKKLILTEL